METIKNVKIIPIMQRALNFVDQRLVVHGIRVAYLMYKVLSLQNRFTAPQMRDICLLGMLHDIGAYKTEEIDRMVIFETIDVWDHSIYGYLFLKYFSPLSDLAPVILYHHADCAKVDGFDRNESLPALEPLHRELAQLISLCDRADVYLHYSKDLTGFYRYVEQQRDIKYLSSVVDMFTAANINLHAIMDDLESDREFLSVFYDTQLTMEEVDKYIQMVVFSIDFRCSQTVIHSITVASIARILAKLSGVSEHVIEKVKTGAMLQGIGKVAVAATGLLAGEGSKSALDKKTYADITEKILSGNVDDEILRAAAKYHEKQNNAITLHDRLLAVADIISALCFVRGNNDAYQKEKVAVILKDMCKDKLLDPEVVALAINNFENIIHEVNDESQSVIDYYNKINEEYVRIRDQTAMGKE